MHRNVASYYLNPMLHYNPEFKVDNNEVRRGIYGCLDRLEGNNDEISKIDTQIEDFESKS